MIKMCGAKPVLLETKAEENYLLNPEELEKCLQSHPKAKAIILCDPSNPTGSVSPRSLLEKIAKVLEKYPKVIVFAGNIITFGKR
jgi:aspartate/glutamate/aspartate-prephenate aminotransferase